jgi:hypothetical protein
MATFKLQAARWPEPPRRYQAIAIAVFLLIVAAMPMLSR